MAPLVRSSSTIAACPLCDAQWMGAYPELPLSCMGSCLFTSCPLSINIFATMRLLSCQSGAIGQRRSVVLGGWQRGAIEGAQRHLGRPQQRHPRVARRAAASVERGGAFGRRLAHASGNALSKDVGLIEGSQRRSRYGSARATRASWQVLIRSERR